MAGMTADNKRAPIIPVIPVKRGQARGQASGMTK